MKRRFISGLLAGMMAVSLLAGLPEPVKVSAKTVSGLENANFNFEEGITGWESNRNSYPKKLQVHREEVNMCIWRLELRLRPQSRI